MQCNAQQCICQYILVSDFIRRQTVWINKDSTPPPLLLPLVTNKNLRAGGGGVKEYNRLLVRLAKPVGWFVLHGGRSKSGGKNGWLEKIVLSRFPT